MSLFLLINGLDGGSTDANHPGWFEIDSVQMGAGIGVSQGVASAPSFSEVVVSLRGLSPALLETLAKGTGIASIRIQEVNSSGAVAYDLLLGNVQVMGNSFSASDDAPSSSLSFAYDLIGLTTPTSSFGFDIPNDQPIQPTAIPLPTRGGSDVLETGNVTQYTLLINDGNVTGSGSSKSWFEISSLQLGAGAGTGGVGTDPSFSELTVTLQGVSPALLDDLANGDSLSSIQIKGVNGAGELVYDLRLGHVLVSGESLSSGGDTPSTALSFAYERIGLITPTSSFGYDTVVNDTIDANSLPTLTAVGPDAVESGAVSKFFMAIDGLNGGSTFEAFKGWFELESLQLGAGVGVANGVASLPSFSEVTVSMAGVSPEVLDVLSTGTSLNAVRIQGVTNTGTVLYDLRLADVLLSGNSISSGGGGAPSSSLSLHYERIGLTTPDSSFGYDTVAQQSILAASLPTAVPDGIRDLEAAQVTQFYMAIDGFNGGSVAENYKGWFEIDSLSLGAGVGIGNDGQASAPTFSELVVSLQGVSPTLLGSLATGAAIDAVRLQGVNGLGEVFYDLRLADVVLSGNSLGAGSEAPSASLSFAYDRIGLNTPTSSFGYDKVANVAIDPATLPAPVLDASDDLEDGGVTQYYLMVDGLNGGSADVGFKGWFEIDSLQLGVSVGVGGGQVSAPYFSEVVVTLTGLSPALLGSLATQHVFDAVRVQGVNGAGAVVYDLRLGEVQLTSDAFSSGGDTPASSLAFAYQRIGLVTPESSFGFNLATQSPIDPLSIAPPVASGPDVLEAGSVSRFFLRVEGVEGGSTAEHHQGAFELTSLQLGAGLGTSGPLASPASFSELVVTMIGLSPALLAELATRSEITSIQVEGVNFLGDVIYEMRLGEVFLSGYSLSSGGDTAQASLSFAYERIGLITPSGMFGHNLVTDRSIDPNAIPVPGDINEAPVVSLLTAGVGEDAAGFSLDLLTGASDPNAGTALAINNLDASVTTSGGKVLSVAAGDFTLAGSTLALTAAGLARFNGLGATQSDLAVFHFNVSDGALSTANTLQLTINGANDLASISGTAVGAVTEDGGLTASGVLAVSDADAGQAQFAVPASLAGTYGTFSFNALTGAWGYTLNNALAAVQLLNAGQTLPDSLSVASLDGSAVQAITVTINGVDEVGGFNVINGTDAANFLIGTAVADRINGLGGDDQIEGAAGGDAIDAGPGADSVHAGDDNDTIYAKPGDGNDSYNGGDGNDTLVFETSAGANVNLATANATSAQTGVDTLKSIENVSGGTGNDLIIGSAVANVLAGGDGNDTLAGGNGNDTLIGGEGDDVLNGGKGDDLFVFAAGFGNDRISDFDANPKSGQDLLDLTAYGITAGTFGARVVISDIGANTLVMIDGLDSIVFVGMSDATHLTIQDFML